MCFRGVKFSFSGQYVEVKLLLRCQNAELLRESGQTMLM